MAATTRTAEEMEAEARQVLQDARCKARTTEGYIEWVANHPELVGKKARTFWLDIMGPIVRGEDPVYVYDPEPVERFVHFTQGAIPDKETLDRWISETPGKSRAEKLRNLRRHRFLGFIRQVEGEWTGDPLILEPWQVAFIGALFGTKRRSDGRRRFSEAFLVVARKNGKTTMEEPMAIAEVATKRGANVFCAATAFSQSRNLWERAASMIQADPTLDSILTSRKFPAFEIHWRDEGQNTSRFQPLPHNPRKQDGFNPSLAIIDEVHELDGSVYDILKQGQSSWREPLLVMITTSGFVRGQLFDQKYSLAQGILEGKKRDDSFMPVIYEIDPGDDIHDPRNWFKANPSAGSVKSLRYLADMVVAADNDPIQRPSILTKDFNQIGVRSTSWLPFATVHNDRVVSEEEMRALDGTAVVAGFDLSATSDLTAWCTLVFDRERGLAIARMAYWCTRDFLANEKEASKGIPWQAWIDQGWIKVAGDHLIDYRQVESHVAEEFQTHNYQYIRIQYDPWQAPYLVNDLHQMGFSDGPNGVLRKTPQGFRTLSVPMTTLRAMLESKRLIYQANPVTEWMLLNVQLETDRNGNLMPAKGGGDRRNKIDGVSAMLDALVGFCEDPDFFGGPELAKCAPITEG